MFHDAKDAVRVRVKPKKESNLNNSEELYDCDLCKEGGWHSETEIEIHMKRKHKNELKHLRTLQDFCELCCKSHNYKKKLLEHWKSEHLYSSEDAYRVEHEIYVCDNCDQVFFNKLHLIIHLAAKEKQKKQSVQCPGCELSLQLGNIWYHSQKHMIQSVLTCRICFLKCKNHSTLKTHLATHNKYYKCDMCGFSTLQSNSFQQHIERLHKLCQVTAKSRKIKQYFIPRKDPTTNRTRIVMIFRGLTVTNGIKICILCREICKNYDEMKNHIVNDHNYYKNLVKDKLHRCLCGEIFLNKVLLKHHVFKLKGDHKIVDE